MDDIYTRVAQLGVGDGSPDTPPASDGGGDDDPYTTVAKMGIQQPAPRKKGQYDDLIEESAARHGVDPDLVRAQMNQESTFKPGATSPKGAAGLMQLMPATAQRLGVTNIYDPKQNIEGGVKYMRQLLDMFGGSVPLALAGYNAGEGAVQKHGNKIPPYKETQNYVKRITSRYQGSGYALDPYSTVAKQGLENIDPYSTVAAQGVQDAAETEPQTEAQPEAQPAPPPTPAAPVAQVPSGTMLQPGEALAPDPTEQTAPPQTQVPPTVAPEPATTDIPATPPTEDNTVDQKLIRAGYAKFQQDNNLPDNADTWAKFSSAIKVPQVTPVNALPQSALAGVDPSKLLGGNVKVSPKVTNTPVQPTDDDRQKYQSYAESMRIKGRPAVAFDEFLKHPPAQNPSSGANVGTDAAYTDEQGRNYTLDKNGNPVYPPPLHQVTFKSDAQLRDDAVANLQQQYANQGRQESLLTVATGLKTAPTEDDIQAETQRLKAQQEDVQNRAVSDTLTPSKELDQDQANEYLRRELQAKYPTGDFSKFTFLSDYHPGNAVQVSYGDLKNAGVDVEPPQHERVLHEQTENPTPDLRVGRNFAQDTADDINATAILGPETPAIVGAVIGKGGELATKLGGAVRFLNALNPVKQGELYSNLPPEERPGAWQNDLYKYLQDAGVNDKKVLDGSGIKDLSYDEHGRPIMTDAVGTKVSKFLTKTALDLVELYATMGAAGSTKVAGALSEVSPALASAVTGGTVFGSQAALDTAGQGGSASEIGKQTLKGVGIGATFGVAAPAADVATDVAGTLLNSHIPQAFTTGAKIGAVGVGTYTVARLAGDTPTQAFQEAVTNAAFDLGPHVLGHTVQFLSKAGLRVKAKISPDGEITVAPENQRSEQTVLIPEKGPAHIVVDATKPVADVAADDTRKKIAPAVTEVESVKSPDLSNATPVKRATFIPETQAEPEATQYTSVLDEIRQRGLDTKRKIQSVFPHLTREEAADLGRQAYGEKWGKTNDVSQSAAPMDEAQNVPAAETQTSQEQVTDKTATDASATATAAEPTKNAIAPEASTDMPADEINRPVAPTYSKPASGVVMEAPRTVSHPDPEINGKPIVATREDGKVVVPNDANKSGVSVVTDHGETQTNDQKRAALQDSFELPLITHPKYLSKKVPVDIESESGLSITRQLTIRTRQEYIKRKADVLSKLVGCIHGG